MQFPAQVRPARVVIVGAGVAGIRTSTSLRRRGYAGEVVVVDAQTHVPYDRPPLSKQVLTGDWSVEQAALASDLELRELDVRLVLGRRVTGMGTHGVTLDDGTRIEADVTVIATGSRPQTLSDQPAHERVHVLGNLDDSLRLRASIAASRSLVIVGAGLIGGEVATAARAAGLRVEVIEAGPHPFARALGAVGGELIARRHRGSGVRIHAGRWVETWEVHDDGLRIVLDNGHRIVADIALVATGARPSLDWLVDPSSDPTPVLPTSLDQGLACDSDGRVIGCSNVYAVGDAASWADLGTGVRSRGQHWTLALEQAEVVAAVLAARSSDAPDNAPFPVIATSYVWSDQAGTRIQVIGNPHLGEEHLELATPTGGSVVVTSDRDLTVAVTLVGAPRCLGAARAASR